MPSLTRRAALACLGSLAVAAFAGPVRAADGKLVETKSQPEGVTLVFALENAPFPVDGGSYDDPTVIVFVPRHYRLPKSGRIDAVIHFHGHNTTALQAIEQHRLREQVSDSKQNAILIVPQGPVRAADSSGGKLEQKDGLARMLDELLAELVRPEPSKALGVESLMHAKRFGTVCVSAHSGGYHVTATCLDKGGVEVSEVYLFDALYGNTASFRAWLARPPEKPKKGRRSRAQSRHKLISYYATATVRTNNVALMTELRGDGVEVLQEHKPGQLSRAELTKGAAIFIASPLEHGSVTYRHNDLRDSLYASALRRRLKSDWFAHKNGARPIDSRD